MQMRARLMNSSRLTDVNPVIHTTRRRHAISSALNDESPSAGEPLRENDFRNQGYPSGEPPQEVRRRFRSAALRPSLTYCVMPLR